VQDVVAGGDVLDRGRGERAGVGAGPRLGDRVAPAALAAERRIEVAAALRVIGVDERVVRAGDESPQAPGDLTELLVDEHLLERAPALAAELAREGAAMEVRLDGAALEVAIRLGIEVAARALEVV